MKKINSFAFLLLFFLGGIRLTYGQISVSINLRPGSPLEACRTFPILAEALVAPPQSGPMVYDWILTDCNGNTIQDPPPLSTTVNPNAFQFGLPTPPSGCYCLGVLATNQSGQRDTSLLCNIYRVDSPNININITPSTICPGGTAQLSCNSTTSLGFIDTTLIQWGCGLFTRVTGCPNLSRTYLASACPPGCYNVLVTQSNNYGCFSSRTFQNAVCILEPPVATFTADSAVGLCVNNFTSTMTAGPIPAGYVYEWYVNNQIQSGQSAQTFSRSYAAGGCYDIKLVVRHPTVGCVDSMVRTQYVCVYAQPTVTYTQSATSGCLNASNCQTVTFTNTTIGVANVDWYLQGFPASTGPSATYTICNPGTYSLAISATLTGSCKDSIFVPVAFTANESPVSNFTCDTLYSCTGRLCTNCIADACQGCTYSWQFQSGGVPAAPTGQNVRSCWNGTGTKTVVLNVTSANGCSTQITRTNYINNQFLRPAFTLNKVDGCSPIVSRFYNLTNVTDSIVSAVWSFPGSVPPIPSITTSNPVATFTQPGCYDVRFRVTTVSGCTDSITVVDTICVGRPPVCGVTVDKDTMCFEADTACFTFTCDTFDYVVVDYGDGVVESQRSIRPARRTAVFCHVFQDVGNFTVRFIPARDSCTRDTLTLPITIFCPAANFIDSSSCLLGDTVFLRNKTQCATSYTWNFLCTGDSVNSYEPRIVFPTCDTCTVVLTARNDTTGCVHQKILNIQTACLGASFSPQDTFGCAPFSVRYTNRSSSFIPGQTRWDWNTDDGVVFTETGTPRTHVYTTPGIYNIAMTSTTAVGNCRDTVFGRVVVCDILPDFVAAPTTVCLPAPICFTDRSTDSICAITRWEWRFGDGTTDTIANPCHVYSSTGVYQVKLVVTNENGCRDSITRTVTAAAQAAINIAYDSVTCPGVTECLTNTSTSVLPLSYSWQFLGGTPTSSVATSPCVAFQDTGTYFFALSIDINGQCTVRDTGHFYVYNPEACGTVSQDTFFCLTPPPLVQGFNCSIRGASNYTWDWGDGVNTSTSFDTASHQYNSPGSYIVRLIACSDDGCCDTASIDTVYITGPSGSYTFSPLPGVCSCEDSIVFDVTLVGAANASLFYGCANGFFSTNISQIGTVNNPTHLTVTSPPYCQLDSCLPLLIFGDSTGCIVQYQDFANLILVDSPVVYFTYNNVGACDTGSICFFDETSYHLRPDQSYTVSWNWDFGDGTSSTSSSPCHRYLLSGVYDVTLNVQSNLGCDKTITRQVIVSAPPIANFSASDTIVCSPAQVCFADSSIIDPNSAVQSWSWNFGDNSNDNSQNPCHTYNVPGNYLVTFCVTDTFQCTSCDTLTIQVKGTPVVNAGNDTIVCYGSTYQFNGTGGSNCSWQPAASFVNPSICNPSIVAVNDGQYILTVSDQFGCVGTDTMNLLVAIPTASFTLPPTNCLTDPTCFTDASSFVNGTAACWNWSFGDNTNAIGTTVCHTYASAGTYQVTFTVCDNHGCTDDTTMPVTIYVKPTAIFSLNDSVVCANEPICATDVSTGNGDQLTTWSWDFGDGTTSNVQNPPCHLFPIPPAPSYQISLVVATQNGCVDSARRNVVVNEYPNADFTWSVVCEDEGMPLASISTPGDGPLNGCQWILYLGSPSPQVDNNCATNYQFPAAGSYDVMLIITDINGCADSIVKTVRADSLSTIFVNPGDTSLCLGTSVSYTVAGNFDNVRWTPGAWLSNPNSANVVITPQANISYVVSAVNGVCDAASDTVRVRVIQPIPLEVDATPDRIVLGLTSNITSYVPGRIDSIVWSPDNTLDCRDCPNPIATPAQTTTYTATIYYGENGTICTNSAQVTITVINSCTGDIVYVPNTFTPNGDGKNDVFMIRGLGLGKVNYFRIFDRWGKLVFEANQVEANNELFGWTGLDKDGKKLNSAVFVYTYEVECINGDIVTGNGNVTLIR